MKKKRLLVLFLIIGTMALNFVSCAKKQSPDAGSQIEPQLNTDNLERHISITYPINAENMRQISETEIKSNYQTLLTRVFPEENKSRLKTMKGNEMNQYLYEKFTQDTQIVDILTKFQNNGIIVSVGPELSSKRSTRYGDGAHKVLGKTATNVVFNLLNATGEKDPFLALIGSQDTFMNNVTDEDYRDPVFQTNIIGADAANLSPVLNILSIRIPIEFDTAALVTLAHFWNPDRGWNAGLSDFFPRVREYAIQKVRANSYASFIFLSSEIPSLVDMALNVASNFLNNEYLFALIKNPPSSYYKALCYWYGWKTIKTKYIAPGGYYIGTIDVLEENHPGVMELVKTDPTLASYYLAHVMHLVEDASVPAHAHCDSHAPMDTFLGPIFGGEDVYENFIVNSFITDIVNSNSYRFVIQGGVITDFSKNTVKTLLETTPIEDQGYFYKKISSYSNMFQGTYGLWPLFFNSAQAAQFFPTFKNKINPRINVLGNKTIVNGSYALNQSDTVSAYNNAPYNDSENFDTGYSPSDIAASKTLSEKGTYYLVYTGDAPITDDEAKNAITISNGIVSVAEGFKLQYLGYPFNKMAETLVPIAISASTRLAKNYYRSMY